MSTVVEQRDIVLNVDGRKLVDNVEKINKSTTTMTKVLEQAKSALLLFGVSMGVQQATQFIDSIISMDNALRGVTHSAGELTETQDALYKVSQETRSSIETNTALYARLSRSLADSGVTGSEVIRIIKTLTESFKISGAGAEEQSSALLQLSQAFQSNRLAGDEFRAVAENAPIVLQLMAKQLGVTTGELRKMSTEGKLTADVLKDALVAGGAEVDAQFQKVNITLGDVFTTSKNWLDYMATKGLNIINDLINHDKAAQVAIDAHKASAASIADIYKDSARDASSLTEELLKVNQALAVQDVQLAAAKEAQAQAGGGFIGFAAQAQLAQLDAQVKALNELRDKIIADITVANQVTQTVKNIGQQYPSDPGGRVSAEDTRYQTEREAGMTAERADIAEQATRDFEAMDSERDRLHKEAERKAIEHHKKLLDDEQNFNGMLNELTNKANDIIKKSNERNYKEYQDAELRAAHFYDKIGNDIAEMAGKAGEDRTKAFDDATKTQFDGMIDAVGTLQKAFDDFNTGDFVLGLAQGLSGARDVVQSMFDTLSALSQGNFGIQKGLNIAEAIMNGALAIMKTFATYGATPVAFGLAGVMAAITSANVALIAQQQPTQRASGGLVRRGGSYEVGERSSELFTDNAGRQIFIPSRNGNISPNASMSAHVNIINNGSPLRVVSQKENDDGGIDIVVQAVRAVEDRFERSLSSGQGKFATSLKAHTNTRRQY
jgi:tape measure domain-containing protein